jgi:hypothetical protein
LRGSKSSRESVRHFGHSTSPGNPHTHDSVKPRIISKDENLKKLEEEDDQTGSKYKNMIIQKRKQSILIICSYLYFWS